MSRIPESELILNPDGSVYHLHLLPENLADTVIVVGDPGRVAEVSKYFDKIEFKIQNREIATHTGTIGKKRLTVLSTGMGTDNLDIVVNELDALVNIDLKTREPKPNHTSLNIIRLGTSGALKKGLEPGSAVASTYGMGMDGLLYFYKDHPNVTHPKLTEAFCKHTNWDKNLPGIYAVKGSETLLQKLAFDLHQGITLTAPGFYGPQGRQLRLELAFPELNRLIESFQYEGTGISNFEMETSALYGLGKMLGFETLTICTIVANRVDQTFLNDYKPFVDKMVRQTLERLTN